MGRSLAIGEGDSICNRTRETQFRILHRLQIAPQLRHRMNPSLTEMCSKCHVWRWGVTGTVSAHVFILRSTGVKLLINSI